VSTTLRCQLVNCCHQSLVFVKFVFFYRSHSRLAWVPKRELLQVTGALSRDFYTIPVAR